MSDTVEKKRDDAMHIVADLYWGEHEELRDMLKEDYAPFKKINIIKESGE